MKKFYHVFTLLIFVLAYKGESIALPASGKQWLLLSKPEPKAKTASVENETIVGELERLKNALQSKSIYPLLRFFEFPISEENMAVFGEEPTLRTQIKHNKGVITKNFFKTYFNKIYELLKMKHLLEVLSTLNIGNLNSENILYFEKEQKEKPCSDIYQLWIEDNSIFLLHEFGDRGQTMVAPPHDIESGRTLENIGLREDHCNDFSFHWKFSIKKGKLIFENFEIITE